MHNLSWQINAARDANKSVLNMHDILTIAHIQLCLLQHRVIRFVRAMLEVFQEYNIFAYTGLENLAMSALLRSQLMGQVRGK